ncbi:hypothetical protein ACKWTF_011174 [Chironomus riparius]
MICWESFIEFCDHRIGNKSKEKVMTLKRKAWSDNKSNKRYEDDTKGIVRSSTLSCNCLEWHKVTEMSSFSKYEIKFLKVNVSQTVLHNILKTPPPQHNH